MTEQKDEIRLKQLLSIFGEDRQKEIIEILHRDQIRYHQEQLTLTDVSSSYAVQKVHFYSMISTYLKASEEVENGIYDPIEDALQEIQQKYLIIQKA